MRDTQIPDLEIEHVEPAIRAALDGATSSTVECELPPLKLTLDWCVRGEDTPIWDSPINGHPGKVIATRPDGETLTIPLDDGHGWEELAERLVDFSGSWEYEAKHALRAVRSQTMQLQEAERKARIQRGKLDDAIRAAHEQGVTMYRLAKATGFSQPTIKRIVK